MSCISSIAEQIVFLPKRFQESERSFSTLLNDTGYANIRAEISVMDLREAISKHPECIRDWLGYSEDKRVTSGWFFQEQDGRFTVGHFQSGGEVKPLNVYDSDLDACAEFIKMEIESML